MKDYLLTLESHLDPHQARAVSAMERIAYEAATGLWLTGGAVRDMLCSLAIADLDFTVERGAVDLGRALALELGGEVLETDALGRWVELGLHGAGSASVSNARTERRSEPGGTPEIAPAMIHDDLRRRDFTINAIAVSLGKRSRGLLVDPLNGEADLADRELRSTGPNAFFDDPSRIFRLVRFRHAFGLELAARTVTRLETALQEGYHLAAPKGAVTREVLAMSMHHAVAPMVSELDSMGAMALWHPALTGAALNLEGLARFGQIASVALPPGSRGHLAFLSVLLERLDHGLQSEVISACGLWVPEASRWPGFAKRVAELQSALGLGPRKPSEIWRALEAASVDEIAAVLYRTDGTLIPDRIAAYFDQYKPAVSDLPPADAAARLDTFYTNDVEG